MEGNKVDDEVEVVDGWMERRTTELVEGDRWDE